MTTIVNVRLPNGVEIWKTELSYNDFINLLTQKSLLDKVYESDIEFYWVDYFDHQDEEKIMNLKSVKSLFNSI